MNRRLMISLAARLLGSGLALLAASGAVRADQSEEDKIKAVVAAYHAAISSLDINKMDGLWAHDDYVMSIQPRDKAVSVGWDAVRKAWEDTFAFWSELKVTASDGPHIRVNGGLAWSDGMAIVNGKSKAGDQVVDSPTFESDVLEKRGDAWLLVSHSAWRAAK
jgi:ketosteroid isomerase-like protein